MFVHGCQCEKVRGRICLTVSLCKRKKGNDTAMRATEREAEKEYGHEGSERAREHGGDGGEREREREKDKRGGGGASL